MVWRHPYFQRMAPLGFFVYGGMVAMQTLWAGPWMQQVAGYSALESATGLFWINLCMLCTFWAWGMVNPWLLRHGLGADRLILAGLPLSLLILLAIIVAGPAAGARRGHCSACRAPSFRSRNRQWAWPFRRLWRGVRCRPSTW